jgi:hypothetical protein
MIKNPKTDKNNPNDNSKSKFSGNIPNPAAVGNNSKKNNNTKSNEVSEVVVAAIAAAIFKHSKKIPKQLIFTTPAQELVPYNVWGVAGRQDLMAARDMTGQVGFQY